MTERDRAIERIARHFSGRWLQGYVRGKLRSDPIFEAAAEVLKNSHLPILDLGCGVGLFEFYLREMGHRAPLVGCDFDERKISQALAVAAAHDREVDFRVADLLDPLPVVESGHVVIFDVLHYLPAEAQRTLLVQVAERVAPGGLCLIRATPRDRSWRFRATQIEEWFIRAISWQKSGAVHYASVAETIEPLVSRGFEASVRPLWGRTPFNSQLLILRRPSTAGAPS